jgi:2-keto-4-pentenoate hydratase/2-oxohepta-3-ene-1,7-dioic acid hydratase in catechol pathway
VNNFASKTGINMKRVRIKNKGDEVTVGKIVCVGRNYAAHAAELGNEVPEKPVLFLKPASALIFSGGEILHPNFSDNMHHEVELVLLIGERLKDADEVSAEKAIAGIGVGLDMTLRDIQDELKKKGHPWTIAKCFDTSAAVSDFVSAEDYRLTLNEEIVLTVNGTVKQKEKLGLMLFPPAAILQYISTIMTLEPGDLVYTGTPAGVSRVNRGDKLVAEIADVVKLECEVV